MSSKLIDLDKLEALLAARPGWRDCLSPAITDYPNENTMLVCGICVPCKIRKAAPALIAELRRLRAQVKTADEFFCVFDEFEDEPAGWSAIGELRNAYDDAKKGGG